MWSCRTASSRFATGAFQGQTLPTSFAPVKRVQLWRKGLRLERKIKINVWQEVLDPATGNVYYWNTSTNETTWERPPVLNPATGTEGLEAGAALDAVADGGQTLSNTEASDSRSHSELLSVLREAYLADDAGGMLFAEVAREHRRYGVFDESFFSFIAQQIRQAPSLEDRELLERVQARLSNPLLRQAAPFE